MTFRKSLVFIALCLAVGGAQPVQAQWWKKVLDSGNDPQQYPMGYAQPGTVQAGTYNLAPASSALKNVEKGCDQLMPGLQMKAASGAQVAPLVVSLNALKDAARQARRAADSNDLNQLQSKLGQVQIISQNAVTFAQSQPTIGDAYTLGQLQMIQGNVQQAVAYANSAPLVVAGAVNPYNPYQPGQYPNPYNPYQPNPYPNPYNPYQPNPYYPGGFTPGILQASGNGRGNFTMMGQNLLAIKTATISAADPVGKRVTFTMSQGNAAINLMGTVVSQTPTMATISVNGSDRGAATGTITGTLSGNGSLMSANGSGTLNGQPFVVSFRGN